MRVLISFSLLGLLIGNTAHATVAQRMQRASAQQVKGTAADVQQRQVQHQFPGVAAHMGDVIPVRPLNAMDVKPMFSAPDAATPMFHAPAGIPVSSHPAMQAMPPGMVQQLDNVPFTPPAGHMTVPPGLAQQMDEIPTTPSAGHMTAPPGLAHQMDEIPPAGVSVSQPGAVASNTMDVSPSVYDDQLRQALLNEERRRKSQKPVPKKRWSARVPGQGLPPIKLAVETAVLAEKAFKTGKSLARKVDHAIHPTPPAGAAGNLATPAVSKNIPITPGALPDELPDDLVKELKRLSDEIAKGSEGAATGLAKAADDIPAIPPSVVDDLAESPSGVPVFAPQNQIASQADGAVPVFQSGSPLGAQVTPTNPAPFLSAPPAVQAR